MLLNIDVKENILRPKHHRSFETILSFFEDSEFQFKIKKYHRTRYRDHFEKFYVNYCYFRDHGVIGYKIAEGGSKIVFEFSSVSHKVIKLYKDADSFRNEKTHYEILLQYRLENIVPTMQFYDQHAVVDIVSVPKKLKIPKKLKGIIFDQNPSNFGLLKNQFVVLDLNGINFSHLKKHLHKLQKMNRS